VDENWNACLQTLEDHSEFVSRVAVSPDSRYIASASADRTIKIWDAQNGACVHTLRGHTRVISAVAFSPDGQKIISGSDDQTVKLWDVQTAACLLT
jgi:WD40 repeat protein